MTMTIYKKTIVISIVAALLAMEASYAHATVVIESEIEKQIQTATATPRKLYPLDFEENSKTIGEIDRWADTVMSLSHLTPKSAKTDRKIYRVETSKNNPIMVRKLGEKGIQSDQPFSIKYVQMPRKRSLSKNIRVPTLNKLEDRLVADIGQQFITANHFVRFTAVDAIKDYIVVNRLCRAFDTSEQDLKTFTILQRVIFKRQFDDMEVLNSKQIVDIHPDSGEILAYKSINWTPVDEVNGAVAPTKSADEVIHEIKEALEEKSDRYQVTKIKSGMFQTDKNLIPVLAIYTSRESLSDESIPIQQTLLISLAKNIDLPKSRPTGESPKVAHKD